MQSRTMSVIEQVCNIVVGVLISYILQRWMFPKYGIYIQPAQDLQIIAAFTVASFIRGYGLRRIFNYILGRK